VTAVIARSVGILIATAGIVITYFAWCER